MNPNLITTILNIFILIIFFVLFFYNREKKVENTNIKTLDFIEYMSILRYSLEKSYDIIYKKELIIYSIEGSKVDQANLERYTRSFVNIVLRFLGPKIKNELVSLFGDEDTLYFHIAEYFNVRYESDEIFKETSDGIMNIENDSRVEDFFKNQ